MDDAFGNWFAGLAAGEGCFTLERRAAGSIFPRFRLCLRADDISVLEEVRSVLAFGTLHTTNSPTSNPNPMAAFSVSRLDCCISLVHIFSTFPLRAKKEKEFEIWRRAVAIKSSNISPGRTTNPVILASRDNATRELETLRSSLKRARQWRSA